MLYIASALTPTPILHSIELVGLTAPGTRSLVLAKPDRVEIWDIGLNGLTFVADLAVWGSICDLAAVDVEGAHPHFAVLTSPPNAHFMVMTYTSQIAVTASVPLSPPTPQLRRAEFFAGAAVSGGVAFLSLWTGVLHAVEMEVDKERTKKRRTSASMDVDVDHGVATLRIKDNYNVNIMEHNLVHLAIAAGPSSDDHVLSLLSLSPTNTLHLQLKTFAPPSRLLTELTKPVDLVTPTSTLVSLSDDYAAIPFSCPAARRAIPIPSGTPADDRHYLVLGDEYAVLYAATSRSHVAARTSPRASAVQRSPQAEIGGIGKRRKSSMTGRGADVEAAGAGQHELRPVWRVRLGYGTVLAHASGATVLLSDDSGRLTALGWQFSGEPSNGSARVRKIELGQTSPASALTYLGNTHLFLASACDDSAVVALTLPGPASPSTPSRKGKARGHGEHGDWAIHVDEAKGRIEVKERWMNMAPVKDFVPVMDEGETIRHLVVASGAANANSLRIVRSGVGLEDVVSIEGIEGVSHMVPLTSKQAASPSLLLSTSTSTVLLSLQPEVVQQTLAPSVESTPTLAAALVDGALLQVTPMGVHLWADVQAGTSMSSHAAEQEIVAAQIAGSLAIVGARGGEITVLSATANGLEPVVTANVGAEIAAVAIYHAPNLPSPTVAVATWAGEILVAPLDSLSASTKLITESAVATSLVLRPAASPTSSTAVQLLAGLNDGSLVAYDLEQSADPTGAGWIVKSRKASSLGAWPLTVSPVDVESEGEKVVGLGVSDRLSVLYESRGRVDASASGRKGVTAATAMSVPGLGDVVALATSTGVALARVASLRKLQVQTLDTGARSVARLAHVPDHGVLVAGAVERAVDREAGDIVQRSWLELRDPNSLAVLHELAVPPRCEITVVEHVFLRGAHHVALGLAVFDSDDAFEDATYDGAGAGAIAASAGRVVVYELVGGPAGADDNGRAAAGGGKPAGGVSLRKVASEDTLGPVHDVAVIHGFLAVAAASKVSILRLDFMSLSRFTEVAAFHFAFVARHLRVLPARAGDGEAAAGGVGVLSPARRDAAHAAGEDRLVVGDGMRSVFVVEVDEESGQVLGDLRDLSTLGTRALEVVRDGGQGVVVVDQFSNVLTLRIGAEIESGASFGLHEEVTRFRRGSLAPPLSAPDTLRPELLFATSDGRLGVLGELAPGAARTLADLQRNMAKYRRGPGGVEWAAWRRAGSNLVPRDTAGFVDGDFVQAFLAPEQFAPGEYDRFVGGTGAHEHVARPRTGARADASTGEIAAVLEAAASLH